MNSTLIILIGSALLLSASDLVGRAFMSRYGFTAAAFFSFWFLFYFILRTLAMIGQLYVFTRVDLGRTIAMFGAVSIVLAHVLGLFILKESISTIGYIGAMLAIVAFIVLAFS